MVDRYADQLTRVGLDLGRRILIRWWGRGGGLELLRGDAGGNPDSGARPDFAGETRYRVPGLGFGSGFVQGIERTT
jgi:hypothetical protein